MARTLACSVGALSVLIAVSACGSSGSKNAKTTPSTPPGSATSTTASTSAAPSTSASPTKLVTKLHGTCDTLLPQPEVEDLMGIHFVGKNAYVVGVAEKNIGRLGYLNCRYGLGTSGKGSPTVEVGISLYTTPAQAKKRLSGTVTDYLDHGATRSTTEVAGNDATLLVGKGTGYDVPLLVVASDQRTVAVSVAENLLSAAKREPAMVKLVALALDRTAP